MKRLLQVVVVVIITLALLSVMFTSYQITMPYTHISNSFSHYSSNLTMSDGLHCEEVSDAEYDEEKFRYFWQTLNEYELFHEEGIRQLNKGDSSSVRTLTWHCGTDLCGGLGYRIYGITVCLLLAMHSNRVLLLKWDRISAENTYLLPNKINWKYPNYTLKGSFNDLGTFRKQELRIYQENMTEALSGNAIHVQLLYNSIRSLQYIVTQLNTKYDKSEENLGLSEKCNILLFRLVSFKFLFRISEELKLFASEVRNKLNLHTQKYVALHVRTGDFINERGKKVRFMDSEQQMKSATRCAIKQAEQHIGPNGTVIVVSDSASVKQKIANMDQRIKFLDNVIVHVDKEELDESGMLGTWQDIIIMAEARIIVYGHSSFPELSMAICGVPKSRIVHYRSCYVDSTNTASIPL